MKKSGMFLLLACIGASLLGWTQPPLVIGYVALAWVLGGVYVFFIMTEAKELP